jgi:DNA-binding transcriptional LysR family regulator
MYQELLMRRGLSMERLYSFLRVADAGSIAKAAGTDTVRQSQFSRQIGELEEFFGVRLTRRHGRSLELTEEGRELAALIRAQFDGLDGFLKTASDAPVEMSIGAGDSLITWLILPRLAALQRKHPRLRIKVHNLRSRDIIERLGEMRLDFGLVRANTVRPPLKQTKLGSISFQLFVPKQMLRLAEHLTPMEMLSRFPIATLGSDGDFFDSLLDETKRRNIQINLKVITESFPQAARAVMSGHYAGVLPSHAAIDLAPIGVKSYRLPFLNNAARSIVLAWSPRAVRTRFDGEAVRAELAKIFSLSKVAEEKSIK